MQLKQKSILLRKEHSLKFVVDAVSYRLPRQIMQVIVLRNGYSYPICPRCDVSFDGEYTSFCDRCGQRLAWDIYPHVGIRRAGEK